MTPNRWSLVGGVTALVLAAIILLVDDTKNAATYFAICMLIVIGAGQIVGSLGRRSAPRA